ncbi:MAG: SBBP repeat-containing protein [Limisphaerales bacterium]
MKNHTCPLAPTFILLALSTLPSLAPSRYEPDTFTTLAGHAGQAQLYIPSGVAVDSAGNVYVADMGNYMIGKGTSVGV